MRSPFLLAFGFLAAFLGLAHAQTLPPSDVLNLIAEEGNREVVLTWDAAEDDGFVSGYRVYYGTSAVVDEDDSYEDDLYTNSTDTTHTVTNLLNGVEYFFSITAIDDDQEESLNYSNEIAATPIAPGGGDEEAPKVISATHTAPNEVTVVMSETIAETDPTSFLMSEQSSFNEVLIEEIRFNSENLIMTVTVDGLIAGETYDLTATSAVEDLAGNPVSSGITDTVTFVAVDNFELEVPVVVEEPEPVVEEEPIEEIIEEEDQFFEPAPIVDVVEDEFEDFDDIFDEIEAAPPIEEEPVFEEEVKPSAPDNVAPLEAQNLRADTSEVASSNQVTLNWEPALDLDSDIADQVLYTRTGIGSWDEGYSLGKTLSSTTMDVQPNQNYQVRLVTVDTSGNESEGAVFSFSTNLSQTGPGTVIALAIAMLIGMMMLLSSRRRA